MSPEEWKCLRCGRQLEQKTEVCPFCHYKFFQEDTVLASSDTVVLSDDPSLTKQSTCVIPESQKQKLLQKDEKIKMEHTKERPAHRDSDMTEIELNERTEHSTWVEEHLEKTPIKPTSLLDDLKGHLFGRCQVLEKLGEGGMGKVYKAYHTALDQFVVLKALPMNLAHSPEFRERFLREARAAAKLHHQNIVQVLDAGYEHGIYFYIMEFVDGDSLEKLIKKGYKFSIQEACRIIRDVALGLELAHQHGIIHRDIKASNILLTKNNVVKVADFGLASDPQAQKISLPGQVMGTPQYMSPEQWDGYGVDARSDLYSLGVTFYYILTNNLPFDSASTVSLCKKHAMESPISPRNFRPEISPKIESIVLRLLQKKKEKRYQTARELVEELDKVLKKESVVLHPKKCFLYKSLFCLSLAIGLTCLTFFFFFSKSPVPPSGLSPKSSKISSSAPSPNSSKIIKQPTIEKFSKQSSDQLAQKNPSQRLKETPKNTLEPNARAISQEKDTKKIVEEQTPSQKPLSPQECSKKVQPLASLPIPKILLRSPIIIRHFPLTIKGKLTQCLPPHTQFWVVIKNKYIQKRIQCKIQRQNMFRLTIPYLEEGRFILIPEVVRNAPKKERKKGKACVFIVDTHPPILKVITPQNHTVWLEERYGNKVELRVSAKDRATGIKDLWVQIRQKRIPLQRKKKGIYYTMLPLKWGKQTYKIIAIDKVGHSHSIRQSIALVPKGMVRIPKITVRIHGQIFHLKAFYIDRTEVTNQAYESYLQKSGNPPPPRWPSPHRRTSYWRKLPVVFVNHYEALAYARFIGKRLPTEEEWIVAGLWKNGRLQKYPWGNEIKNVHWPQKILPVGSWPRDRSFFGVWDMASNVAEWTSKIIGKKAVRKGGYYQLRGKNLSRFKWAEDVYLESRETRNNWLGFRCALSEE